jgi:hypothetical protein
VREIGKAVLDIATHLRDTHPDHPDQKTPPPTTEESHA